MLWALFHVLLACLMMFLAMFMFLWDLATSEAGAGRRFRENLDRALLEFARAQERFAGSREAVSTATEVKQMSMSEDDAIVVIRERLREEPDVDLRDEDGRTLLFTAAANGHVRVARLLVDHGAEVNASDNEGSTPLHFAATEGHTGVVEFLLEKGAEVNAAGPMGLTPTFLAASEGYEDTWRVLRAHGGE